MAIEPYNIRCRVHRSNSCLRITIPKDFHNQNNIEDGDDVWIIVHRVIKSNGSVIDLCKAYDK